MNAPALHVFLVAGEESGDRLGAALMQALRQRCGPAVRFSGVGGAQMAGQGLRSLFPLGDLAIVGFATIPMHLRKILRRIRQTADAVIAARPDVLVIIDSPEFTHRVARNVRARAPALPIVDYVCPSVWAWRPGRARAMRAYIDEVLALLPFEPAAVGRLDGPPCIYVGHPLSERVAELRPNAEEAQRRLAGPPVLLVLPGSRSSEIERLADVFGRAVALISDRVGGLEVIVPAVPRLADMVAARVTSWKVPARVVSEPAEKNRAFRLARAALTKSGTSTLELAVAGVPMVAAYKVSLVEELVARLLIKVPSVILANLVLGENVVPELMQRAATPEALAQSLLPLLSDTPERRRQIEAFKRLDGIMEIGAAVPSDRAATAILECAGRLGHAQRETVAPSPLTA
ncbi:MAG TPA: lipid-A-disaccharide synthase [Pseudolabrys sp.]|nr:lipid-A-disaccharide synthase [Pseudolabrys sp.]